MNASLAPAKRHPIRGRARLAPSRVPFSPSLDSMSALEGLPMAVPPPKPPTVLQRPPTGAKIQREKTGDNSLVLRGKDAALMRELSSLRGQVSTTSLSSLPAAPTSPTSDLKLRPFPTIGFATSNENSLVLSMWRKFSSSGSGSPSDEGGRVSTSRGWGKRRRPSQDSGVGQRLCFF
ncbi:hypothetical protein ElyMa_002721900 [Elysia marginata]|uniref:WH2 domain-containing protein n=1 Tax=Elysia marginata TaxID=1093978 RepID=A0AAV4HIC6_9GAST|nr:hypothetical protein ElyMa_002721900 [Elysia marginata]